MAVSTPQVARVAGKIHADYAIVATPTNYDSDKNLFDTSSVEAAVDAIREVNPARLTHLIQQDTDIY